MKSKNIPLYDLFFDQGIKFFAGVPDSLLSEFSKELENNNKFITHLICPNEGSAIGSAIGYYAAKKKIPAVYMQNSGLGNAINPIISLASKKVWSIPMVLIIGWRGSYGIKDEPQHKQQGKVTEKFLKLLGIEYQIYKDFNSPKAIQTLIMKATKNKTPVALLLKEKYSSPTLGKNVNIIKDIKLSRFNAIKTIKKSLHNNDIVISTTGKTSRELFLLQRKNKENYSDLFVVGGMGHASAIALGILNSCVGKRVILLDGDGALLMHMGILSLLGKQNKNTFIHILLNNKVHDSVGGQPTSINNVDVKFLVKSMKYKFYKHAKTELSLFNYLKKISHQKSSHFVNVDIKAGSVSSLPRPTDPPIKNFQLFQDKFLHKVIS